MNRLAINSISYTVQNKKILRNISFTLEKGDVLGLLGRSGSGKTTLLEILFGIQKPEYGDLLIDGKLVKQLFRVKTGAAFLPQNTFSPHSSTVEKCINLFQINSTDKEMLKDMFSDLLYEKTGSLSGGERRFLEIMLILSMDKEFFFLDEPFCGLDPQKIGFVKDMIEEKKKKSGIIISSHLIKELEGITSTLFVLKKSCLTEVKDEKQLGRMGFLPLVLNENR